MTVHEWGDPAGMPYLDFHGTPGGRLEADPDPTVYARLGLRRITLDRPGYGGSDRRPGRTVADLVPDVEAVADALGLERFAVAGISGGGPFALACAALLPSRVERCLAVASVAPPDAPGLDATDGMADENRDELDLALAGEDVLREALVPERAELLDRLAAGRLDLFGDDFPLSPADQGELPAFLPMWQRSFADSLHRGVDGWVDDGIAFATPWGFDVAAIAVPTAIAYGLQDTFVPPAHGAWLAARISGATALVSQSGHLGTAVERERRLRWLAGRPAAG